MDFGGALAAIKAGKKAHRKAWSGKYIYIALMDAGPDVGEALKGQRFIYACRTPESERGFIPWMPAQKDLLAEDWMIAE